MLFHVGLRLPVFSRVPFLVSDLACLVCTVQIKVVSIFYFIGKVVCRDRKSLRPSRLVPTRTSGQNNHQTRFTMTSHDPSNLPGQLFR